MRLCEVEGCEKRHAAKGFCWMHYSRWRAHGDPHKVLPRGQFRQNAMPGLKAARESLGMTRRAFALGAGVPEALVRWLEDGGGTGRENARRITSYLAEEIGRRRERREKAGIA